MYVTIDRERCTGHGRCYALAPDLFSSDADGYGSIVADGAVEPAMTDRVRRAAANCPERAIAVR